MKSNIYQLELFEEVIIKNDLSGRETIKRVPGGWILIREAGGFSSHFVSVFIPYDTEFLKNEEVK